MKRIISILLALCLVGCGLTYPTGLDKKSYEEGKKALKVMDDYNGGDLETDITETKVNNPRH